MSGFYLKDGQKYIDKDPAANKDYSISWVDVLTGGETISTSVWTVDAGLTTGTESKTDDTTTVYLSGGTSGRVYHLKNTITTSAGRDYARTFRVNCKQVSA
jgi:hypothetical protein